MSPDCASNRSVEFIGEYSYHAIGRETSSNELGVFRF